MDLQQALSILARVGAGETLSLAELTQARDVIARQLHSLRGATNPDLDALTTLRESYFAADAAVQAATEAEQAVASEVDQALADIPNPDEEDAEDGDSEDEEEDGEDGEDGDGDGLNASGGKRKKGKMLSVQEAVARLGLTGGTSSTTTESREPDLAATSTRVIIAGEDV